MKKITLFMFTLLMTSIGFSQDLITNGDFEADAAGGVNPPANWEASSNAKTNAVAEYTVVSPGTYGCNLGNDFQKIEQIITPTADQQYKVTFYYFMGNANVDPADAAKTRIYGIDANEANANSSPKIILSNGGADMELDQTATDWTTVTYTFKLTAAQIASVHAVKFSIWKPKRNTDGTKVNSAFRLDDVSIVEDATANLDDLKQFGFSFYPNPAKDNLYLNSQKEIQSISVFNLIGQKMLSIEKPGKTIDVSNLSKGVYMVKTNIQGNTGTFKFIKE